MAFILARRAPSTNGRNYNRYAGRCKDADEGESVMPISKYRVRSTCLSCGRRVKGNVVAVVTTVKEDKHQPRAYLIYEGCQSAILHDIPFEDGPTSGTTPQS